MYDPVLTLCALPIHLFCVTPVEVRAFRVDVVPILTAARHAVLITSRTCSMASDFIVLMVTLYCVFPRPWSRIVLPSGSLSRVLLTNGMHLSYLHLSDGILTRLIAGTIYFW